MNADAMLAYDIFISYSSPDKQLAQAACAVLESHRIRCWIAPRDITPGTEWGASIIGAIDSCKIMVLIFSTHANESGQVRREVERGVSKGLILLPFRVQDVRPAGAMEFALSNTHWLDAFTPPVEAHLETLSASVQVLLTLQSSTSGDGATPSQFVKSHTAESTNANRRAVTNTAERAAILIDLGYTIYAFGLGKQTTAREFDSERARKELRDLYDHLGFAVPEVEVGHEMFNVTRRDLLSGQEREYLEVGMRIAATHGIGLVIIAHKGTNYEEQGRMALLEQTRTMQVALQSFGILEVIERRQTLREILFPNVMDSAEAYTQRLDLLKASIKAELRRQCREVLR